MTKIFRISLQKIEFLEQNLKFILIYRKFNYLISMYTLLDFSLKVNFILSTFLSIICNFKRIKENEILSILYHR